MIILLAAPLVMALLSSEGPSQETDIVAIVGDTPVLSKALDEGLGNRLLRLQSQEYEIRSAALEELIAKTLLEKEAAARHLSLRELVRTEIEERVRPVTEDEIQVVLDAGGYSDYPPDEARARILARVRERREEVRREDFVEELKKKWQVTILLEPPRISINTDGSPALFTSASPVNLVVFSDFQCPYSARLAQFLKGVVGIYKPSVNVVFKNFPLPSHREAAKAAEACLCANEQGKFWEMHDRLFENQKQLQPDDLVRYAAEAGLQIDAFNACLAESKFQAAVRHDIRAGTDYGVSGTPTVFVNGRMFAGLIPAEALKKAIDEELRRAGIPSPNRRGARLDTPCGNCPASASESATP